MRRRTASLRTERLCRDCSCLSRGISWVAVDRRYHRLVVVVNWSVVVVVMDRCLLWVVESEPQLQLQPLQQPLKQWQLNGWLKLDVESYDRAHRYRWLSVSVCKKPLDDCRDYGVRERMAG